MKKTLLYLSLATLAFLNFSCDSDDKDADEIIPEMELTMNRSFIYHDTHETKSATYTTDEFQGGFLTENEKLTIVLNTGTDGVSFEIEEDKLKGGYVGVYSLQSLPNPSVGDAYTVYIHNTNTGLRSVYLSLANTINGSVEITNYNEKHKLISGTFELTMEDVPDPNVTTPPTTQRRCDVTITGTFENAKLTTNP